MSKAKTKESKKDSNKSKRKKRLIFLFLFLIMAALPLIVFNKWASQPNSQTIVIGNSVKRTVTTPKFQTLKTDYFSVVVPSGWKIRKDIDQHVPTRLQVLTYATSGNSQAAITTDILPSDGLNGIGDYHLRITDTARYAPISPPSFPQGSKTFKSISGEVGLTTFVVHGNRYASLTTSGQDTFEQASSLLNTMLNSWQWTQKL